MYYRRNADTAVRTAQRQYAAGQISAEALVAVLRRANVPVEIAKVYADKKTLHVNVDLEVGTPDSVFGPWDLDERLTILTLDLLHRLNPSGDFSEFDFQPIEQDYILAQLPELLPILQEYHLDDLLYRFLVNMADGRPHLTMCFSLLRLPLAPVIDQVSAALHNFQLLQNFFGLITESIWFLGNEIQANTLKENLSKHLQFTGKVEIDLALVTLLPTYPNFTLIGHNVAQLRDYCYQSIRRSGSWRDVPPGISSENDQQLCPIPERQGPGQGSWLGVCLRQTSGNILGQNTKTNPASSPLELLTFVFFISAPQPNIDEYFHTCMLIQWGQVIDALYEESFRNCIFGDNPDQVEYATRWLYTAALDLAKSNDVSVNNIVWLT